MPKAKRGGGTQSEQHNQGGAHQAGAHPPALLGTIGSAEHSKSPLHNDKETLQLILNPVKCN
jgi:hypothetical protein